MYVLIADLLSLNFYLPDQTLSQGSYVDKITVDGLESHVWQQYRPKEYLIIYNDMFNWVVGSIHMIEIEWKDLLRKDTTGLYESSYVDSKGERHYMAVTQRRVFKNYIICLNTVILRHFFE